MTRRHENATILSEPILWGSLVLRLVLWGWVLFTGFWRSGDTHHYIWVSGVVCGGDWGGVWGRPTLYAWFLCLFSPYLKAKATASSLVALPLFAQSLLLWICGVVIWRLWPKVRSRRVITALWVFDPVLLVFGAVIMSDAVFSILAFAVAVAGWKVWTQSQSSKNLGYVAALGALLGLLILTRSVGLPILVWSAVFALVFFRRRLHFLLVGVVTAMAVMAPQIYWNGTRHSTWSVLQQGGWFQTVVGVVEYHDTGVDFYEAEARWVKDPRNGAPGETVRILTQKAPTFIYLTAKGIARVLFGHVNVDWGALLLGTAPVGPGWFKVPEVRVGPQIKGVWVVPWVLGILLTLSLSLFTYWRTLRALMAAGLDAFSIWALGCIALLAATPLLWGDARFRASVWPFILVLWAASEGRALKKKKI